MIKKCSLAVIGKVSAPASRIQGNAIAHGAITFEEGAYDLTLNEIDQLANRILPYLKEVSISYQNYLENKLYLANEEVG
jgi:hypothetical protein